MNPYKPAPRTGGILLLLAGYALSSALHAEINLRREVAQITESWAEHFADGALAAAVKVQAAGQAVAVDFGSNSYVAQSLIGNDQYLKGIAFYGGGLNATPLEYNVSVLDYGARKPVMSLADFNPPEPPTVMTSGTITLGRESMSQVYLSFNGADSIFLKKDHAYVIIIGATRDSNARFYRAISDEGYPQGTGASGPLRLSPDVFSANGSRDILFALYTSPAGK